MATFRIDDIRQRAQRDQTVRTFSKSAAVALNEALATQSTARTYDIFLSHSYKDAELILGVKLKLEDHGYNVYVDWVEDPKLDRSKVTRDTAETIRDRMDCCKSLFYSTTPASSDSKWMPWECGYMDGKRHRSAILPLTHTGLSMYDGQEYLSVYPYVMETNDTKGKSRLWVHESPKVYCSLDEWFDGKEPRRHN